MSGGEHFWRIDMKEERGESKRENGGRREMDGKRWKKGRKQGEVEGRVVREERDERMDGKG